MSMQTRTRTTNSWSLVVVTGARRRLIGAVLQIIVKDSVLQIIVKDSVLQIVAIDIALLTV